MEVGAIVMITQTEKCKTREVKMANLKDDVKKLYSYTNKYLYTNKAKRECKLCYLGSLMLGLSCHWIQKNDGLCRNILIKDIQYMTED